MVIAAVSGSLSLALTNLNRFLANPTVVSIQKDFRNWMNHLPAATGCLNEKISYEKAKKYIKSEWNVEPTDEQFSYFYDFVKTISNTTYFNLGELKRFEDDKTLAAVDMVKLVTEVHPDLSGQLVTFEKRYKAKWKLILTELGICITFNSKFANLLEIRNAGVLNNSEPEDNILKCHYLNRLCYARYDSDPNYPLKYHIHSYLDIAHINLNQFHQANISDEVEINYKMTETDASPDIRYLSPTQRRCRFDNEPLTNNLPYYSTTICFVMCRYEMALKLCGCKPFFYHFLDGKTCDIRGLLCLSGHADIITQSPLRVGCKCAQPCNLISYLPQIPKFTRWQVFI
ncbi:unnamed protein product [Acanthoscelides obtectus]|uniref:Sodium channel protein Nach n=1 Tax=Acanthoscelides obtectus TaxID=200917 RepID=A0A9P0P4E8_ACAOB|nr:unnamed protein product [Acanthoscelides obtectus]CAK1633487.1 hypothetical protein AOBTE_LOCUS8167 [Acanthoscelides obtectus]